MKFTLFFLQASSTNWEQATQLNNKGKFLIYLLLKGFCTEYLILKSAHRASNMLWKYPDCRLFVLIRIMISRSCMGFWVMQYPNEKLNCISRTNRCKTWFCHCALLIKSSILKGVAWGNYVIAEVATHSIFQILILGNACTMTYDNEAVKTETY